MQLQILLLLDVLQPGVEDLFDAMQFGQPEAAHIVEATIHPFEPTIHRLEATIYTLKFGIDVGHQQADHGGVREHRNADSEVELNVRQIATYSHHIIALSELGESRTISATACPSRTDDRPRRHKRSRSAPRRVTRDRPPAADRS